MTVELAICTLFSEILDCNPINIAETYISLSGAVLSQKCLSWLMNLGPRNFKSASSFATDTLWAMFIKSEYSRSQNSVHPLYLSAVFLSEDGDDVADIIQFTVACKL